MMLVVSNALAVLADKAIAVNCDKRNENKGEHKERNKPIKYSQTSPSGVQ
jgi:hypothetical protein